jgi:pSer/pThr/pTyr-binding forkhead associated (FHA) protein
MAKAKTKVESSGIPYLEQVAGAGRGRVFELGNAKISVGRIEGNDIVIPHESVSREHAHFEGSADGGVVVFDNGSKNGVIVNGQKVDAAPLNNGDIVQMGAFAFRYNVGGVQIEPVAAPLAEVDPHHGVPDYGAGEKIKAGPPSKRPMIYGGLVVLLGVLYMYSGSDTPTPKTQTTEETGGQDRLQVSERPDFEQSASTGGPSGLEDPTLKAAEQELSKLDFNNQTIRESEAFFRRGQNEYFNKNYHRAIDAFQTSLAIYRSHPLAKLYLGWAVHDAESDAKKNLEIGIKYFESLQYQRAIYHFQQVITLMSHRPGEKVIKDCEKYVELSKRRLQAAEMFP